MDILWLNWKDQTHPGSGGAEVVLYELSRRMIGDGHKVTWLTSSYPGNSPHERVGDIDIIRIGRNRYLHSFQALNYYLRNLRNKFDIVIEVVNTSPYFSVFFGGRAKRFLFYHQLAGDIWFHETAPPLSHLGRFIMEPLATRLLAGAKVPAITVSESTKDDLTRYGFAPERTSVISEGITMTPLHDLDSVKKYARPTLLSLGAMRAMKRTMDQITAFELAKQQVPDLQLIIAGDSGGEYGKRVLERIAISPYASDISYHGKVAQADKIRLMQKSHVIMQTALKEGWGLTVTEAASQGTPAVVYNVDGLRDSVRDGETGFVSAANPLALSDGIVSIFTFPKLYNRLRQTAWEWSKEITFERSYEDLKQVLGVA